jgi:hypothetical protein
LPTIHIECGIADKIEIKIYNIAAELVHEADITDRLKIKQSRRGFGQVYAYEYPWDVKGIASGVYIYIVKANKGKENIKVMNKLAIIK